MTRDPLPNIKAVGRTEQPAAAALGHRPKRPINRLTVCQDGRSRQKNDETPYFQVMTPFPDSIL